MLCTTGPPHRLLYSSNKCMCIAIHCNFDSNVCTSEFNLTVGGAKAPKIYKLYTVALKCIKKGCHPFLQITFPYLIANVYA